MTASFNLALSWALRHSPSEDDPEVIVYDLIGVQEQTRGRVVLNCSDEKHARALYAMLNSPNFVVGGSLEVAT